jgi:hypothetical protein
MSSHHDQAARVSPPSAVDDALGYWWPVCRGEQIMRAFLAAPEVEAWQVVERHPALLLPELIDAAERVLGRTRALDGLREMHHALRGSAAYAPYHRLLVAALAGERRGSRRVNLERALAVMKQVRRAADDPADEHVEQVLRAELAALIPVPGGRPAAPAAPAAQPPRAHALFLDDAELAGLRRGDDRRGTNPNPHDRAYATHGGLAAGSVEWLGDPAAPVYRVVDARWVFASSKAARAYLESPATQLLARDGLANPAVVPIGDGAHAWDGARSGPGGRARQCLLFRVDRVVARLDVTEGPGAAQALQALSRAHVLPYADAVVRRVRRVLAEYWLAIGRDAAASARARGRPRGARGCGRWRGRSTTVRRTPRRCRAGRRDRGRAATERGRTAAGRSRSRSASPRAARRGTAARGTPAARRGTSRARSRRRAATSRGAGRPGRCRGRAGRGTRPVRSGAA